MALQPYADPGQTLAVYEATKISSEEQERREKEVRSLCQSTAAHFSIALSNPSFRSFSPKKSHRLKSWMSSSATL